MLRYVFTMVNDSNASPDDNFYVILNRLRTQGLKVKVLAFGAGHPDVEVIGRPIQVIEAMEPLGFSVGDVMGALTKSI